MMLYFLTFIVDLTMNLMSGFYHKYKRKKYHFLCFKGA